MAAGEQLEPGLCTYVVPSDEARKLSKGKVADIKDARGDPVHGVVTRIEHGNRMSIVVVEVAS